MRILVDTNLPLRIAQTNHPQHSIAQNALATLSRQGAELCILPQTYFEFWSVATRPLTANGGLGLTVAECTQELNKLDAFFTLLPDPPDLLSRWRMVVMTFQCQGKTAHDARLVAAVLAHQVNRLLTFNVSDFRRYPWLTLVDANQYQ
jgi:predicted nucleic acid-binding protein